MKKSTFFLVLGLINLFFFISVGIWTELVELHPIELYVFIAFKCLISGIGCLIIWKNESNRT
jgi:hypothetical protein